MADSSYTNLSVVLSRTSPNYAPAKPIQETIRDKKLPKTSTKFEESFRKWFTAKMNYEKPVWDSLYSMAQLVSLFRRGDQLLVRRPFGQTGYYVRPIQNDDTYRQTAMNLMTFHSQISESKLMAVNPTVNMRPGDDTPEAIAAAQACRPVVDFYETEWYTAKFTRREAIRLLTDGIFIHQVRWNPFKGALSVPTRQVNKIEQQADPGEGKCADCDLEAEASEFEPTDYGYKCPQCGSEATDVRPPETQTLSQISMGAPQPVGEPEIISSSLASWRWNLAVDLEKSSWAIKRQYVSQGAIKLMLGDVTIPDSGSSDDYGLDILHALTYSGQAFQGTALRFDTPIATPNGWKEIWELGEGDQVFSEKGEACSVTSNSGIATERPCYEVEFSDGSIIVADENHLWDTYTYNERAKFSNRTSEWRRHRQERRAHLRLRNGGKRPDRLIRAEKEVALDLPEPTATTRTTKEIFETLTIGDKKVRYNHFIKATLPLDLLEQDLPLDPYKLGLWLGDGTTASGGFTTADDLHLAFKPEFEPTKQKSQYGYIIKGLQVVLRQVGVLGNKHIPDPYLRGSFEQRLALLQGLMDTDGSCDKANHVCQISTISPKLRDDIIELIASLGIVARYGYRPSCVKKFPGGREYKCKEHWRISFYTELPAFRMPRKLAQQKTSYRENHKWRTIVDVRSIESVPVCCITVDSPSHLYLAGTTMIPTHNSMSSQYGRDQSRTRPTMFEAWLSPEDQAEIECDEGETICGVTMPKGRISNFFQGQPICVVGFNDGALILATYAGESQQQEVVTCQWYMDAESGAGRGMEDTAAVQRRFNAVDGQIYQGLATTATPPVFVDMRMLREDSGQYLFKPGVNHDVNLSMLPVGMRMQDAIYLPQPGQVSQQFMAYGTEFLGKNMANLSSLAVEFSDLLSIDNRTATGAQISAALANSLYGPMLMSKAESRVEIAKKIVHLQAKFGVASRFFPGKGDARGREVGGQALKGKVLFELMENSHLPVTPYSQISDVTALLQAFGGNPLVLSQLKSTDPELFKAITRPFSALQLGAESDDEISTLCLTRLEQMKEAFEAGVDDPNILIQMITPPPSMIEPKLKDKAEWNSRWLDLDSAQKAPMVIRQAIEGLYHLYMNLDAQRQMPQAATAGLVQGIGAAAAAAPTALGGAALQNMAGGQDGGQAQDHAHEASQAEQDRALEAHQTLAEHEHELKTKALEGDIQLAVTKQQGQNAIESAKVAGENALKVQRAKPKVKPSKAA